MADRQSMIDGQKWLKPWVNDEQTIEFSCCKDSTVGTAKIVTRKRSKWLELQHFHLFNETLPHTSFLRQF